MMSNGPCMRRYVEYVIDNGDDAHPSSSSSSSSSMNKYPKMDDDETLEFTMKGLEVAFSGSHPVDTNATIFITTKRVVLHLTNDSSYDFDPQYIMLHAITRDSSSYPKPCLYCQLDYDNCDEYEGVFDGDNDGDDNDGDNGNDNDDLNNDDDDANEEMKVNKRPKTIPDGDNDEPKGEMFIVPADESELMSLFDAFSRVALLNPDNGDDDDDDDDGDDNGLIYNVDEVELGAVQARNLARFESVFQCPEDTVDGQFDDK